jgi:hypothetical protein
MTNPLNLQGFKWEQKLTRSLVFDFSKDPVAHTFAVLAPPGQLNNLTREAIRYFVAATNHPAGDPDFQRRLATHGMSEMVAGIVQAHGLPTEVGLARVVTPAASAINQPSPIVTAPVQTSSMPFVQEEVHVTSLPAESVAGQVVTPVPVSEPVHASPANSPESSIQPQPPERKRNRLLETMLELGDPPLVSHGTHG